MPLKSVFTSVEVSFNQMWTRRLTGIYPEDDVGNCAATVQRPATTRIIGQKPCSADNFSFLLCGIYHESLKSYTNYILYSYHNK